MIRKQIGLAALSLALVILFGAPSLAGEGEFFKRGLRPFLTPHFPNKQDKRTSNDI